jgi:hypothetical protein
MVLVVLAANVPTSYVNTAEQQVTSQAPPSVTVSFSPISGVGAEAWSYSYAVGTEPVEGVVGVKGSSVVGVFCTGLPTTLSQIETLVNQLFPSTA